LSYWVKNTTANTTPKNLWNSEKRKKTPTNLDWYNMAFISKCDRLLRKCTIWAFQRSASENHCFFNRTFTLGIPLLKNGLGLLPYGMVGYMITKKISLLLVTMMGCFYLHGQVNINGNVFVASDETLYIATNNTFFDQGKIVTDRTPQHYGLVAFAENATWTQADHNAHVDGYVRMHNNQDFAFPVGNDDILQPLHLTRNEAHTPVDLAYNHVAHTNLTAEPGIANVSDEFYWNIAGEHPAYVRLSWNAFSNVDRLTGNSLPALGIAGFDGTTWRHVDAEIEALDFLDQSPSTLLAGSIVSKYPVPLDLYEAFTLVALDNVMPIQVSQAFTPNGDGINDTWFIEKIEDFPNAMIKVFSRWGREVFFSPSNYQNNWDGVYKDNKKPLPDASYFYVIDLDNDGQMDLNGWVFITR